MNNIKTSVYAQKVELLLRLIPIVMGEDVFAIRGGTAINLFLKDLTGISIAAIQKLLDQLIQKRYVERGEKEGSWRVFLTQ